jgi:hypothetical protein
MRHWLKNLRRQAMALFGLTGEDSLLAAFDRLVAGGVVAVGRAIQTAKRLPCDPPSSSAGDEGVLFDLRLTNDAG